MKYVYAFEEGNKDMRDLLGGKGANLAEMVSLGLPIPRGFTITTEACHAFYNQGKKLTDEMLSEIEENVKALEEKTGKKFGDPTKPLLVSVRSGAPISMPGMMDTILNLGLNEEIVEEMSKSNERFAYDSYRRLIQMYAEVVKGYGSEKFEGYLGEYKETRGYKTDLELTANDLKAIVSAYKQNYLEIGGEHFPEDPKEQLIEAVRAVFASWNNDRAIKYRRISNISDSLGTAVNIQEMVYGNLNEKSGTGVLFSRNPMDGTDVMTGEYLLNAQGEDIVAGVRTPNKVETLLEEMPEAYEKLKEVSKMMENHFKDMQDMEFTIENANLFILQTRNGKRTPLANIKVNLDLLHEGVIDDKTCLLRINSEDISALLAPSFSQAELKTKTPLTKGLAASPGASVGTPVFTSEEAKARKDEDTILVRSETSAEDIDGMVYANGILTKNGGLTSHAAVVARGFGKCAVCGASQIEIDYEKETMKVGDVVVTKTDVISIDGNTGNVYLGKVSLEENNENAELLKEVTELIEKYKGIEVRANADTPEAASVAKSFGAQGIGLVRTEHMFFNENRIIDMRKMIVARNDIERKEALSKLEEYQREDFTQILRVMDGLPVIVRYLDPPLHEFLPKDEAGIKELADSLNIPCEEIAERSEELKEVNPMMGFRGARLGVKYPEITEMQTRALITAGLNLKKEGLNPEIEIMIPLTTELNEFVYLKNIVKTVADELISESGLELEYKVGTMIETPRAAILSNVLSREAEFYSFGTNDLTQLTFGLSRDDAGKFLDEYMDKKIYEHDPFKSLDTYGVGSLMSIAKKTAVREIPMGICGEHGGDPASIEFCASLGLNYVSCSPYRVLGARLAGAKYRIKNEN